MLVQNMPPRCQLLILLQGEKIWADMFVLFFYCVFELVVTTLSQICDNAVTLYHDALIEIADEEAGCR